MVASNQDLDLEGAFAWNTGRWYSALGQRIAAVVLENGRVAFVDVDRHIGGVTRHEFMGRNDNPLNHKRLQAFVMREYDNCAYDDIAVAMWLISCGDEVEALRAGERSSGPHALDPSDDPWRLELTGRHVEVRLRIDPGVAQEVAIELRDSDPMDPEVRVTFEPTDRVLSVARRGIVTVAGRGSLTAATLPPSADGRLDLRLLIDGSVLEIEVDRRVMATVRLSAMLGPRQALTVGATGGQAAIDAVETWELTPRPPRPGQAGVATARDQ